MNKLFRTISAAGLIAGASSAFAASNVESIRVTVPFSFVVAGQKFEAGDYRLKEDDNGVITVQGDHATAMVISTPLSSARAGDVTALRFTKQNDSKYLVSVQVEGGGSRSIPVPVRPEHKLTISQ